jgi:hypothetical protein
MGDFEYTYGVGGGGFSRRKGFVHGHGHSGGPALEAFVYNCSYWTVSLLTLAYSSVVSIKDDGTNRLHAQLTFLGKFFLFFREEIGCKAVFNKNLP